MQIVIVKLKKLPNQSIVRIFVHKSPCKGFCGTVYCTTAMVIIATDHFSGSIHTGESIRTYWVV